MERIRRLGIATKVDDTDIGPENVDWQIDRAQLRFLIQLYR